MTQSREAVQKQPMHRAALALPIALGIAVFTALHAFGSLTADQATVLNDVAWWLIALVAALACLHTARFVSREERRTWLLLALGCLLWTAGQTVWNIHELLLGGLPRFPHWMQLLFAAYDWCFVAGLVLLPRPQHARGFTTRHTGNLVLLVCAISIAYIVTLYEPALLPRSSPGSALMVGLHSVGLAALFTTALFLLWSYPWSGLYWSLALIVCGAAIHMASYVAYSHGMMTGTYEPRSALNSAWLFIFGAYACAAYERRWNLARESRPRSRRFLERERWLEAIIPSLMIVCIIGVIAIYRKWVSVRVEQLVLIGGFVFAIALGIREAWVQRQEQNLLDSLNNANDRLQSANVELSRSETRYRELSTELESRVAQRTAELNEAYRELENFSYVVAHDLKAPLRSVNGFGALLLNEHAAQLDDKGREYVARMREGSLRMSRLIDDLLAYSKVERRAYAKAPVDLRTALGRVVDEARQDLAEQACDINVDVDALTVVGDEEGVLLAFRNLVQNAIKFSDPSRRSRIDIRARVEGPKVVVEVADNGIGFDMSHAERIFQMFERLDGTQSIAGTGIGLAMVRKAVERMGGRISATAQSGVGATFSVELPRLMQEQ